MTLEKWISGCYVYAFPWVDGENIYVNVRYFRPMQSLHQAPVWDRSVYITNNEYGRKLVYEYTDTLVSAIIDGKIKHGQTLTVKSIPALA